MKQFALSVPDELGLSNHEVAMIVSSHLYQEGRLSLGKAAEVAGLTVAAFVEILNHKNISIFNYPPSEITDDLANIKNSNC